MAYRKHAYGLLDEGIAYDATSCDLRQGHGSHFDDGEATNTFYAVIWDTYYGDPDVAFWNNAAETVQAVYTSGSDTLALTRAQDGTTARDLNSAGHTYEIYMVLTNTQVNALLALL